MRALFPLDGSKLSLETLQKGLDLLPKAEITLLTVSQHFKGAGADRVAQFDADEEDEIFPNLDSAERLLAEAKKLCKKHKVTTQAVEGKVQDCIIAASAEHDVLVMAALGKASFREKLRLGRGELITRHAKCHVLLVR